MLILLQVHFGDGNDDAPGSSLFTTIGGNTFDDDSALCSLTTSLGKIGRTTGFPWPQAWGSTARLASSIDPRVNGLAMHLVVYAMLLEITSSPLVSEPERSAGAVDETNPD
jgi:hypothetical protein